MPFLELLIGYRTLKFKYHLKKNQNLQKQWPECYQLAGAVGFKFPYFKKTPLGDVVPQANGSAVDLMDNFLNWNPSLRPTAQSALKHQYFQVNIYFFQVPSASKNCYCSSRLVNNIISCTLEFVKIK